VVDLQRLLGRLRLRLGLEKLLVFAIRGALASGMALIVVSIAIWLSGADAAWLSIGGAPLLAALALGVLRWPSQHQTALSVDRRLGLDERLATSVELVGARAPGRFDLLQVRDALGRTRAAQSAWLVLNARARNEVLLALAALIVAGATALVVAGLPRPAPTLMATLPSVIANEAVNENEPATTELPLSPPSQPAASSERVQTAPAVAADLLASRVQQEQAERAALDKLAQGLSNVSASQAAADAIKQGDYNSAQTQLQNLGDEADQLSTAAKQQLAQGLQQAASATAQSDRALAEREQQTAQALGHSTYSDQRQAIRSLADQVQRSGSRSVPSDQLERDAGQLQQQQSAASQPAASARAQTNSNQAVSAPGSSGAQDPSQTSATTSDQQGGGAGQQNGPGIGTGSDPSLYADQPSRLDTSGERVDVPSRLGNGSGSRPASGSEDQSQPAPLGGRTTSEVPQTQQTGQVSTEQNLVPGQQRPVVRGYFR
jgi:hypothetical protein